MAAVPPRDPIDPVVSARRVRALARIAPDATAPPALADARCDDDPPLLPEWDDEAVHFIPPVATATVPPVPPSLAFEPHILDAFVRVLHAHGVVGEDRFAQVVYLALTSRLFDRPVSIVAKGPSSAGKSFVVQKVVEFFPEAACYALSGMSEHALAYSQEPLSHRFLIVYEATGLEGDFASYLLRSLLSEGRIRYETVVKGKGGAMQPLLIEREGPTGLIVTTTAVSLHPENETRLLSVPANDTPEQTKHVLRMLACEDGRLSTAELDDWRSLQEWMAVKGDEVTVPYAGQLAELIPPVAVRLRRDFLTLLNLVRGHALLHRGTRERDARGRVIATIIDYAVVRDLVGDLIAEELGATVPPTVVETVAGVAALQPQHEHGITYQQLADHLGLDKSAARRRARVAVAGGYLKNLETRRGQSAKLVLDEPLPGEVTVLPDPAELAGGTVARVQRGEQA